MDYRLFPRHLINYIIVVQLMSKIKEVIHQKINHSLLSVTNLNIKCVFTSRPINKTFYCNLLFRIKINNSMFAIFFKNRVNSLWIMTFLKSILRNSACLFINVLRICTTRVIICYKFVLIPINIIIDWVLDKRWSQNVMLRHKTIKFYWNIKPD